jgi:hypothetical protein
MPHLADSHIGEEGIDSHAGRQGDRIVSEQSHQQAAYSGGRGISWKRRRPGPRLHSTKWRNLQNDIIYGEQCSDSGEHFTPQRRVVLI